MLRRFSVSLVLTAFLVGALATSASAQIVGVTIAPPKLHPGGVVTFNASVFCFEPTTFTLTATLTQKRTSDAFSTTATCDTPTGTELLSGEVLVIFDPKRRAFHPGSAVGAFSIAEFFVPVSVDLQ